MLQLRPVAVEIGRLVEGSQNREYALLLLGAE